MSNVIGKVKKAIIGDPRDLTDSSTFSKISLVVFLACGGSGAKAGIREPGHRSYSPNRFCKQRGCKTHCHRVFIAHFTG